MENKKMQDEQIKNKVNETIKDMTVEELMIALEEQNNGLYRNLHEIVTSQIDVIKSQQEEIARNREMISKVVAVNNQVNANVQIIVQKQKDLEEYALIASGVKKVSETTVGKEELVKKANEYVDKQEEEEKRVNKEAKEKLENKSKEDKK